MFLIFQGLPMMCIENLFVSTEGNDQSSGNSPDVADGSGGPLKSLAGARDRVRRLKNEAKLSGPVTVRFADGVYPITEPVVFGPEDTYPVTYAAADGARVIFDGGRPVTGWRDATLNGGAVWAASVPDVLAGKNFFSFFVDGARRPRACWPKLNGPGVPQWLWLKDVPDIDVKSAPLFQGSDRFVVQPEDFIAKQNQTDVEVVVLHYWVDERMPVDSYDPETGLLVSRTQSRFSLRDDFESRFSRYYLENVKEALTEPGEWYLDRPSATLFYKPLPGETKESLRASLPLVNQLIKITGDADNDRPVQFLRFQGLSFRHTDAQRITNSHLPRHMITGTKPLAAAAQSAVAYPGVIELVAAKHCAIEDCDLSAVGWYAFELGDGCVANRFVGNHLHDIGAGGVKIAGAAADGPRHRRTGMNVISDNMIESIGRVFHAGAGIIVQESYGNSIIHNHIRDAYYTGISVGWTWGYGENVCRDNRIEFNHIHQLGQGWLSDMGGVYTLGVQPGTTIRHNLIHDIHAHGYGGWGIYPDEGSSHIVIEQNVVFDCKTNCFNQHYGRENIVRNNLFATGGTAIGSLGRAEKWLGFTFERNVCVSDGQPIWLGDYASKLNTGDFYSDHNLYFNRSGEVFHFRDKAKTTRLSQEQWQQSGHDRHSRVGEPGVMNLEQGIYEPNALAEELGIIAINLSEVGPRGRDRRE